MRPHELTARVAAAKLPGVSREAQQARWHAGRGGSIPAMLMMGVVLGSLGACVSVNAPDKPIVIELNINIKQEVIYRLAQDAGNTIDKNKDIF